MSLLVSVNAFDIAAFFLYFLFTNRIDKYLSIKATVILINLPFRSRGGELKPMDALAATDRNTNEIVYQLYGLTDEEIAIVKGDA